MQDRQPTKPNRIKITFDDGSVKYGYMERADEPTVEGTPLNKNTLFNSTNTERFACNLPSEAFSLLTQEPVVTVSVSGWSASVDADGYYTNRVDVPGMSVQYSPAFSLVLQGADTVFTEELAFSTIKRMVTYDGYVVFKANEVPTADITVRIKGV